MTIDKQELKALAQAVAALEDQPELEAEHDEANDALWLHMHCHTILALLVEIERLDGESQNLSNQLGLCDRERRAFRAERDQLKAAISSPDAVYLNMKSGAITKPTLRSMVDLYGEVVNGEDAQLLEIARLRAENEALRKDAERYRFVRKTWCPDWPSEKADAQIDAAMAKEASHG